MTIFLSLNSVIASNSVRKFIALSIRNPPMKTFDAIDISTRSLFSVENPVVEMVDIEIQMESMMSFPRNERMMANTPVRMV